MLRNFFAIKAIKLITLTGENAFQNLRGRAIISIIVRSLRRVSDGKAGRSTLKVDYNDM